MLARSLNVKNMRSSLIAMKQNSRAMSQSIKFLGQKSLVAPTMGNNAMISRLNSISVSNNIMMRCFSKKTELSAILKEEMAVEQSDEVDQDFLDVKKVIEKYFKIHDVAGEAIVQLTKTSGKEKITVRFDCQDKEELEPSYDENDPSMNETEMTDEDFDLETGVPFSVSIEKPSGEKVVVDCVAAQELLIKNVQYLAPGKSVDDDNLYGGPVFEDLDEKLQGGVLDYLEELGIDNDMSYFILAYSAEKEQKEYEAWLKSLEKFVSSG